MKSKGMTIKRGQAITFRVPSDTPDHLLRQLQKLRETEKRNFSSTIASFALEGVKNTLIKDRESVLIPLPKPLSKEQRSWLSHSHSEMLIGTIVYQLLEDPVRATALFATLNSHETNIDDALHLQEQMLANLNESVAKVTNTEKMMSSQQFELEADEEKQEESGTELLGDFIAHMNR